MGAASKCCALAGRMNKRIILISVGIILSGWSIHSIINGELQQPASQKTADAVTPVSPDREVQVSPESSPVAEQPQGETPVAESVTPRPPLEPKIRKALGELLNTSSEGLVEETRNGVTSVDLQRRFRTAPVATIDADGNVQITDYSYLPEERTPE